MQIVYIAGDTRRELDVRVNYPSATVADLVRALDPTAGDDRALLIGDQAADPNFELGEAGLHPRARRRPAIPEGRQTSGVATREKISSDPIPGATGIAKGQSARRSVDEEGST